MPISFCSLLFKGGKITSVLILKKKCNVGWSLAVYEVVYFKLGVFLVTVDSPLWNQF